MSALLAAYLVAAAIAVLAVGSALWILRGLRKVFGAGEDQ